MALTAAVGGVGWGGAALGVTGLLVVEVVVRGVGGGSRASDTGDLGGWVRGSSGFYSSGAEQRNAAITWCRGEALLLRRGLPTAACGREGGGGGSGGEKGERSV